MIAQNWGKMNQNEDKNNKRRV